MFESLSDRLSSAFRSLSGRAQLTEENIRDGLREVRLALLEADVNFKVVKEFVERVRERVLGQEVEKSLTPTQQLVKAVHDELVTLLGGETTELNLRGAQPGVIMMVGLQGSGKTTSAGKLANLLRKQKMRPYLVPVDVYRPAAIDQLRTLARQLDIPCFASSADMKPVDIVRAALEDAKEKQCTVVILDTAGRLHIDAPLMQELVDIKSAVQPQEILFVADAMTGQDAVTVAEAFNKDLALTGVVLTKMDGDARGGAALSIKSVTGASVKYVGVGEKLSDLEVFHPERVAGRILGMGDMLTLIEKAQSSFEAEEAEAMAKKLQKATFDFEDFRTQMRRMKKIGSLENILKLIPGLGGLTSKLGDLKAPEQEMARTEAVINSMTMKERRNPDLINGSRRQRIAAGSGTTVAQVNQVLRQFTQMRQMMQQVMNPKAKGGRPKMPPLAQRDKWAVCPVWEGSRHGRLSGWVGCPGKADSGGRMSGLPGAPGSGKSATKEKRRTAKREKALILFRLRPRRHSGRLFLGRKAGMSFWPSRAGRKAFLVLEQQLYTIPIGVFQCPLN
ncbi:MAG: signal recognition particle protein [Bilophila wadsworthia]